MVNFPVPNYDKNDLHQWADYAELLCLVNTDNRLSIGDLCDRLGLVISDTFINFEEDYADYTPDKNEKFVHNIFENIKYRVTAYTTFYPFHIEKKSILINTNQTLANKFYIYLLMCSSLNFFKGQKPTLTSDFEKISHFALNGLINSNFENHTFGKSQNSISIFTGNIYTKLKILAEEKLNERCLIHESTFPATSSGDGGIDLVAWYDFPDKLKSKLILFGQCKCSPDWDKYVYSTSFSKLSNYFTMCNPNINLTLIPFCYKKPDATWHDDTKIAHTLLIDRFRILHLLENKFDTVQNIHSLSLVEELLNQKEDIV